jgi:hypothetical protein
MQIKKKETVNPCCQAKKRKRETDSVSGGDEMEMEMELGVPSLILLQCTKDCRRHPLGRPKVCKALLTLRPCSYFCALAEHRACHSWSRSRCCAAVHCIISLANSSVPRWMPSRWDHHGIRQQLTFPFFFFHVFFFLVLFLFPS